MHRGRTCRVVSAQAYSCDVTYLYRALDAGYGYIQTNRSLQDTERNG